MNNPERVPEEQITLGPGDEVRIGRAVDPNGTTHQMIEIRSGDGQTVVTVLIPADR